MSFKLSGINGLPYLGVQAETPPQLIYSERSAPNQNYIKNINVGTLWLYVGQPGNAPVELWLCVTTIVDKPDNWVTIYPVAPAGTVEYVTDTGNIAQEIAGVINVLGDGVSIQTDAPGSSNTITISSLTQKVGFSAVLNTQITVPINISGFWSFLIKCDTELFDLTSNYDPASGLFTAPSTGNYVFNCSLGFNANSLPTGTAGRIACILVTTQRNYQGVGVPTIGQVTNYQGPLGNNQASSSVTIFAPMNSGDTAAMYVGMNVNSSSGPQNGFIAGAQAGGGMTFYPTSFSGYKY